jgi:hypothetical protein
MKPLPRLRTFGAMLGALFSFHSVANATYTITIGQSGANVVAVGSGTINTTALTLSVAPPPTPRVNGNAALIYIGAGGGGQQGTPIASPSPSNFGGGGGGVFATNSSTGDLVGAQAAGGGHIIVPAGYVSGAALSSAAQWNNTTLSALGLAPGTYTFTWGSGATADSLIVHVLDAASLSVSTTHSSPIFQAGPGVITATVANTGSSTAGPATVSDTIDSAFTINSVSSGCSASGQTVTCTIASGSVFHSSTSFNIYVTASATASSSISNTATLTDSTDTIATATGNDTIPVSAEAPQVDSSLTQIMLSGSTDNGSCASGNMTLTATDQLQNTGGSTLTNPYSVIASLTGGNFILSQSVDTTSLTASGTATFTFHIQLATCNTFQIFFDVRSN